MKDDQDYSFNIISIIRVKDLLFQYDHDIYAQFAWWRHQMETFSALLAICAGNSPVPGEFPTQKPVTRSFDVYFHLRPDKRLSKQSWGWWFETVSHSLWRHRNGPKNYAHVSCFRVWLLLGTGRLYSYSVGQSCDCSSSSEVQYIPRNMHTVLLCFALLWLCNRS